MFGSHDLPIPPSCLIKVCTKLAQDIEEHLSYPVSLMELIVMPKQFTLIDFWRKVLQEYCVTCVIIILIIVIYTGTNTATIKPDSNNTGNIHFISIIIITQIISHASQCIYKRIILQYVGDHHGNL